MKAFIAQKLALSLLSLLYGTLVHALQPLSVKGSHFVNSATGERFNIIGLDYQPGGQGGYDPASKRDPLSDGDVCLRDAALMQRLGVNTMRVYNLDPTLNHDLCASIFNGVGIYMLLDVNSPLGGESLDRHNPASSYNEGYMQRVFGVVEAFKAFPNTLGFFAGNEVVNDDRSAGDVPPYLRSIQRDMKNYMAKHSSRQIPVGYSAAVVKELLEDTWQYLQCQIEDGNDNSRADFFGLNTYGWCGSEATFQSSGYEELVGWFSNTSIPVFFSEYGCNEFMPRTFDEVATLYGPQMAPVFSGGLIYEFSQEPSNYGLVNINTDGSTEIRTDYDNLQRQYSQVDLAKLSSGNMTKTAQPPQCRSSLIKYEAFNNTFEIPDTPSKVQEFIENGIPNANRGQLVPVNNTQVSQKIVDSSGKTIDNLQIKLLPNDEVNTPGPVPSSTATATGPGSTPTSRAASIDGAGVLAVALAFALSAYINVGA